MTTHREYYKSTKTTRGHNGNDNSWEDITGIIVGKDDGKRMIKVDSDDSTRMIKVNKNSVRMIEVDKDDSTRIIKIVKDDSGEQQKSSMTTRTMTKSRCQRKMIITMPTIRTTMRIKQNKTVRTMIMTRTETRTTAKRTT